jgi:hypothetical protein
MAADWLGRETSDKDQPAQGSRSDKRIAWTSRNKEHRPQKRTAFIGHAREETRRQKTNQVKQRP